MLQVGAALLMVPAAVAIAAPPRPPASWPPVSIRFAGYYGDGGTAARGSAATMKIAVADYVFTADATSYRLSLKVSSALANLLYESEGRVDGEGLHPVLYRESRRLPLRGPSVRELRLAEAGGARSDTASTTADAAPAAGTPPMLNVPRGTQDRLSAIAQVSWLARSQPRRVRPGADLTLPLASWDSVDDLVVTVGAPQSLTIENGVDVKARPIRRRNTDGRDSSLDFWLTEDEPRSPAEITFVDGGKVLRFVRIPG